MAMRQAYETAFNIFNHDLPDDPKVPWPLLAISPKEALDKVDPLDFRLTQYAENRVHEIFGIPFDQLLHFPRRDYLKVIAAAKKQSGNLNDASDSGLKELERLFGLATRGKKKVK